MNTVTSRVVRRTLSVGLTWLAGCSFSAALDSTIDASIDSPDASPVSRSQVFAAVSRSAQPPVLIVVPFTNAGFETACGEFDAGDPYKALARHPSRPYLYGAESRLQGLAVDCMGMQISTLTEAGGTRSPLQEIVTNPAGDVGFFTSIPPTGSVNVHRFTIGVDGEPAVGGSTRGPTLAGPIALDASTSELFVGGAGVVFRYALGSALQLPTSFNHAASCLVADVMLSGDLVIAFCSDAPEIRRYARTPLAVDANGGSIGAVDRVVAIGADNAIAARVDPPMLVSIALNAGSPTWTDGPTLPSRVTAMAVSDDRQTLLTAHEVNATSAEIHAWRIVGTTITPVGVHAVSGKITALSIAPSVN